MDVNSENSKAKSFQEGCHVDQMKFVFKLFSFGFIPTNFYIDHSEVRLKTTGKNVNNNKLNW